MVLDKKVINNSFHTGTLILLTAAVMLFNACDRPEEKKIGSVVVRKKITTAGRTLKESKKKPVTAGGKPMAPMAAETPQRALRKKEEKPKVASLSESSPNKALHETYPPIYDPKGKIDPFAPLIKDQRPAEKKKRVKRRIPRTPLERIDISQIKLVAIIRSEQKNLALVEEASGKGYIISAGAYIGLNGGRVTRILKDRLIIEEEVENALGEITKQNRELKLQKPAGES